LKVIPIRVLAAGEVNDTLNACNLASTSCVSTLNDDEAHFLAPFMYEGDRCAEHRAACG